MHFGISEIHRAAKGIEHAAIDRSPAKFAELLIEPVRVFSFQAAGAINTDIPQILRDDLPHPGNAFQILL